MILTQLSLNNFGVYKGLHEFDLRPRLLDDVALPLILVGGKNGAGKTTILEAVRLCLYGRSALGSRVRKTDYETYIRQRFHRANDGKSTARSAYVGVMFEHVYSGKKSIYDARRSWRIDGQSLHETISIYKDGFVMRDIASEYWNDFLRDMIPPGVADLFFFDGEQIQALADDESESATLQSAVAGLLNIDIVERLQTDLDTYIKQQSEQSQANLETELKQIIAEREELEEVYQKHYQDRAGLEARRQNIESRLARARQELISQGAQFIEQRTNTETRLEQIEVEIQSTRNQIRDLSAGLLPFAFAPKWSEKLRERLAYEEEIQRNQILYAYQKTKADEIIDKLAQNGLQERIAGKLSTEEWLMLVEQISVMLQPESPDDETHIVHHVSAQQRYKLMAQIEEVLTQLPRQIQALGQKLEALENERGERQTMLRQVPEDEVAMPLVTEFQNLSEQLGSLQQSLSQTDEILHRINYQREELDRKRSKVWQKIAQSKSIDTRVEYAAKIQIVLERYLAQITALKLEELEQLVAQYFNLLCRKEMIIKEVKIDPKYYTVKLYGDNRTELPKSDLSAGEKQLYAMALLWALRSVSGRQLPIIVDTPMGRLDSDHRNRLLTEFFPNAAHQIILLSTDTEVNEQAFEVLRPVISHVYRLDFGNEEGHTQIKHAYFDTASGELTL